MKNIIKYITIYNINQGYILKLLYRFLKKNKYILSIVFSSCSAAK